MRTTKKGRKGALLLTFQFILNDNGYKDELPDPLFYYTISNVSPMDDSFSDLTQETEENSPDKSLRPKTFPNRINGCIQLLLLIGRRHLGAVFLLPSGSGLPEAVLSVEIMADADESAV